MCFFPDQKNFFLLAEQFCLVSVAWLNACSDFGFRTRCLSGLQLGLRVASSLLHHKTHRSAACKGWAVDGAGPTVVPARGAAAKVAVEMTRNTSSRWWMNAKQHEEIAILTKQTV